MKYSHVNYLDWFYKPAECLEKLFCLSVSLGSVDWTMFGILFVCFFSKRGLDNVWDEVVYPGMKKAVVCALLCTQDIVEYRKVTAFSVYSNSILHIQ